MQKVPVESSRHAAAPRSSRVQLSCSIWTELVAEKASQTGHTAPNFNMDCERSGAKHGDWAPQVLGLTGLPLGKAMGSSCRSSAKCAAQNGLAHFAPDLTAINERDDRIPS